MATIISSIAGLQNNAVLLGSDVASLVRLLSGPKWGLFTQSGAPAFSATADNSLTGVLSTVVTALNTGSLNGGQSVGEIEYRTDDRISTAPQQQGSFLSYNKVLNPYQGRVTYIVSGYDAQRRAFLTRLAALRQSLAQLNLQMPEYTFTSCNVIHSDVRRSAHSGVSMMTVDIWVEEVRITGTSLFTKTATAAGASNSNGGAVQAALPTQTQSQAGLTGAMQ